MPCPNGDAMGAFNWLMPALEKDLKGIQNVANPTLSAQAPRYFATLEYV